jgi:hypothetical protein
VTRIALELTDAEEVALRRAVTIYSARIMEQTADAALATPTEVTRQAAMSLHGKVSDALGGEGMVFACTR